MNQKTEATVDETIEANRFVHSFLVASGEYQRSPHFRPENQAKVRDVVERLVGGRPAGQRLRAIDFGCGTGFMIALIRDLFDEVHGIDVTPEMMQQVDTRSGNVFLHECRAESTPFATNHFDFASAYSFMDHLADYCSFLQEAWRVLKPGGIFYADLNPNRAFILGLQAAASSSADLPPLVHKEVLGALHNGAHYQSSYGLDANMLEKAEPIKSLDQGFDPAEVAHAARSIGFSECRIEHQWFLGEASLLHGPRPADASAIDQHLQAVLPVSAPLYKYLRFVFVK